MGERRVHEFSTGTSLTRVAKVSLPIHTLGSVDVGWTGRAGRGCEGLDILH